MGYLIWLFLMTLLAGIKDNFQSMHNKVLGLTRVLYNKYWFSDFITWNMKLVICNCHEYEFLYFKLQNALISTWLTLVVDVARVSLSNTITDSNCPL